MNNHYKVLLSTYDKYASNILSDIFESNDFNNDIIIANETLYYNSQNKSLVNLISNILFKYESILKFDLNFLKSNRNPINLGKFDLPFPSNRINHYCIKSNDSMEFHMPDSSEFLKKYIDTCLNYCDNIGLSWSDRYCFLTIDSKFVPNGQSQRDSGWHIDGMQGDEVIVKTSPDFQFMWCDETPTKFANQSFDISNINPSIHNIFNRLGDQVMEDNCTIIDTHSIYLMNTYNVHTATKSNYDTYRNFIRLNFTHTPITSTRMTINPKMKYNYPIHTTSGEIPKHLI